MNYGIQGNITGDLKNIVKRFEVARAYEGPQIALTWEFYDDSLISAFKIIKKEGSYPLSVNDGILALSDNQSGMYGDLEVTGGTIYYYTLFVKLAGEEEFKFDTNCMGKALAIKTGYYQDALWRLIPQVYRVRDKIQTNLKAQAQS